MTLWQTSLTYQIWVWLCDVYEDSTLHRFLAAAGRWCSGQIEESRILRPLCREGIVARSWRDSFLCRVLSALVNLPGTLLHAWYKAWNLTFEDSFFARLAFDMGDSASIAQFWCIAALWCIPYERWNNAYSFMTGVLLLLLFYAGAMRTGRRLDVARIGFYPALMLAAVTLAVTFSYAPGLSARFLIYHVSAALLVVITVSAVRNGEDLKRLCAGAAVCVGATGAYGIVQRIQGVKVNPSYVDLKVNAGMPGRVFSIFDNPNTFAQVLLLLLPLVLAALDDLMRQGHHWGFTVLVFLCILLNFYIAWPVCLFSILYFLCLWSSRGQGRFGHRFAAFAASGVLAAGLSFFFLLPVLLEVQESKGGLFDFTFSLTPQFNLLQLPYRLFFGNFFWNDVTNGLPNIYCGVMLVPLVLLYFCGNAKCFHK